MSGGLLGKLERAAERAAGAPQRISGPAGTFENAASSIASGADRLKVTLGDKPEYLVQHGKGADAKIYGGYEQKDGSVKFREVKPGELAILREIDKAPEVQTLAQMKTQLAQMNKPENLTSAIDVANRIEARLEPEGRPNTPALDNITSGYTGKGKKPADVAAGVNAARPVVIAELKDEIADMKDMKKKQHPNLEQTAEGGTMSLRDTMNAAAQAKIAELEPAAKLSTAVDAFQAQIVNAPAVAPAAAPAAPTPPKLGNF